jgi:hypothetical protein
VDGYPVGIQIQGGRKLIMFSNLLHMIESLHNPTNGISSTSRTIQYNDNSSDVFIGYSITSKNVQTASQKTDEAGNVLENYEQDLNGNQKASKKTDIHGNVLENWEQDPQGNRKASKITNPDGVVIHPLERAV